MVKRLRLGTGVTCSLVRMNPAIVADSDSALSRIGEGGSNMCELAVIGDRISGVQQLLRAALVVPLRIDGILELQ